MPFHFDWFAKNVQNTLSFFGSQKRTELLGIMNSFNFSMILGNRQDLRLVKHYLEMALPNERFEFLMSGVNEEVKYM